MNILLLKAKWNISKGRFKKLAGRLIHNVVLYNEGRKQELYGKFQLKMSRRKVKLTVV